eukprot:s2701_g1.t2
MGVAWGPGSPISLQIPRLDPGRARFLRQNKVEGITAHKKLSPEFPERGSVFDWVFNAEELKWMGWMDTVEPQQIKAGSAVESIIVQTLDSVRYGYVLQHCIKHRIKLLFCGPTGTGKKLGASESFTQIMMGFSAQTKCAQTQDLIDAKLDRRRKGVYGPPFGKLCVLMVDDLNMPNKETYGAQPPIEILRQMIDARAYPERRDTSLPQHHRRATLRSYGAAGRWTHLHYPADDNMKMIFSTILDWKLQADNYPGEVSGLSKKIVAGTLEIYKAAVCMGHLAGLVSRKLCGSVEGSEVGCHLKRSQNTQEACDLGGFMSGSSPTEQYSESASSSTASTLTGWVQHVNECLRDASGDSNKETIQSGQSGQSGSEEETKAVAFEDSVVESVESAPAVVHSKPSTAAPADLCLDPCLFHSYTAACAKGANCEYSHSIHADDVAAPEAKQRRGKARLRIKKRVTQHFAAENLYEVHEELQKEAHQNSFAKELIRRHLTGTDSSSTTSGTSGASASAASASSTRTSGPGHSDPRHLHLWL